jgi:hypothetical protein
MLPGASARREKRGRRPGNSAHGPEHCFLMFAAIMFPTFAVLLQSVGPPGLSIRAATAPTAWARPFRVAVTASGKRRAAASMAFRDRN